MSTGVVSGAVALMIEGSRATFRATPTPNAIKAMPQTSAVPMKDANGVAYDALTQGAGAINVAGAVSLAQALDPTRSVNSNWLVTGITTNTTIDGQNIVWGDNVVWGDVHQLP